MSLSNATWQAFSRGANVQETWVLWLFDDSANELHLSDRDGAIGTDTMHGFVEDWGDVRRSIDLTKFSAKVDNLSIKLHNGLYHGEKLIETIGPHAVRKWINREARIYSYLNGNAASKMQIYTGRLRNVSWTADSIDLDIEQAQPWDFIRIPDVRTDVAGVFASIIAGNTTAINSTPAAPGYCQGLRLFPLPVTRRENESLLCPVVSMNVTRVHMAEPNFGASVPITVSGAYNYSSRYVSDGYYYVGSSWDLAHTFKLKPVYSAPADWTGDIFSNQANAYDVPNADDSTTYASGTATADFYNGDMYEGACRMGVAIPTSELPNTSITVTVAYSATTGGGPALARLTWRSGDTALANMGINDDGTIRTLTATLPVSSAFIDLQLCAEVFGGFGDWLTVRVYDIRVTSASAISAGDDDLAKASARGDVDTLLVSGCGGMLGWDEEIPVSTVHELHRDLLHRYTGHTVAPSGWSALEVARVGWSVFWWIHEPEDIKKILEQAQHEGAFIFLWSMTTTGIGRYLFVKNSYSAGDVAATISEGDDTLGLKYSHTPFEELVTKQVINYQRHPLGGGQVRTYEHENSAARTAWNIQSLENVETVDLEMLDNAAAVADWAEIRDNIFGNLKRIVSCDIVNPRHFILEIGDVVQFDDDVRYYMITDERRTQGRLSITAREVYA